MNNSTPLLYLVVRLRLYDAAYLFHESLPVFSNTVSLLSLQFLQDSSISLIILPSLNVSLAFHFLHQVQCLSSAPQHFSLLLFSLSLSFSLLFSCYAIAIANGCSPASLFTLLHHSHLLSMLPLIPQTSFHILLVRHFP